MTDVTREVLTTEGLYTLCKGDTVDFGVLLVKLRKESDKWHGPNGANDRKDGYCQVFLVSGGIVFDISVEYGNFANQHGVVNSYRPTLSVEMDAVINWFSDGSEISGYSPNGPFTIDVPRTLTDRTLLVSSDYGNSYLEGIVIKYGASVPLKDKLST